MGKWEVKLGEDMFKRFQALPSDVSRAIAGQIYEVFEDMVKGAPQYSGNFVAHMNITAGSKKSVTKIGALPIPDSPEEAMRKGNDPAVRIALGNAKNFIKNATRTLSSGGSWHLPPTVTIYNELDYAEAVEELDDKELRAVNSGGAHPITKAEAEMQSRALDILLYGSPEFERLKNLA